MSYGTLFGVGVGPGAPDLVTPRAVATLRAADVLIIPRASRLSPSTAWSIVRSHLGPIDGQVRVPLTFPMSYQPARVRAAWDEAYHRIGEHLERGADVAFLVEGDPMLYSSFVYLAREAPRRWPGLRVEVVPGITSVTAVPAACGMPLADGRQRVAIVPAAYGVEDLDRLLDDFDTVVLMKIGPAMAEVVAALERKGLVGSAVYVSRATMAGQRIVRDLADLDVDRGDCFAMIVVSRDDRSGVLLGRGTAPETAEVAS